MSVTLSTGDWISLLIQFMTLSLMSIGGAIATAPEMHRFLVLDHHWLTESQFTSSITLAQAAPGPNLLFIPLLGWNVGINASSGIGASGFHAVGMGLLGMSITLVGILVPSTTLTFFAARWGHKNRELRAIRAFKQGMAPIVIALLIATGWILLPRAEGSQTPWHLWAIGAISTLLVWKTRIHMLWLLATGALAGWFGFL